MLIFTLLQQLVITKCKWSHNSKWVVVEKIKIKFGVKTKGKSTRPLTFISSLWRKGDKNPPFDKYR